MKNIITKKALSRAAGITGSLLIILLISELLYIPHFPLIYSHYVKIPLWLPLLFGNNPVLLYESGKGDM